jgi:signal transduction histidine kinase
MICPYYIKPFLFFVSDQVPPLLYYSHVPIFVVAVAVAVFILVKDRKTLLSRALAIPLLLFSVWMILDLITWTNNSSDIIMFVWSFFGILFILINFYFFRFLYVFIANKEFPSWVFWIFSVIMAPTLFLTHTSFNLPSFDVVLCTAIDGSIFVSYYLIVGIAIFIAMCVFLVRSYIKAEKQSKQKILLIGIGTVSFLSLFILTSCLASILKYLGLVENYQIEQYGFFPLIIFAIMLGYSTVKYKIFNIKLFAAQILVYALIFFIGSQFFFIKTQINFVLNGVTFAGVLVFGYFLIKSVKKEIKQKEQLQVLLQQRESLTHLVTHKVKGAFTRTKYIFAEMLEGTFGAITPELKSIAKKGLDSDNQGISTVDLVLNAANLQTGTVNYDMKSLDLKELVLKVSDEMKDAVSTKGLKFSLKLDDAVTYKILGDEFWMKEVVHNLIDNALKYTLSGEIIVKLLKKDNKVIFSVKDTGVGITEDDKKNLFKEGGRGKDSVKVNVDSTGYGLFTVKLVVEAHKGKIWAESEGQNKGSEFLVELDAI